ncbi:hypothetical protein [Saccharibacter floricola]|uniref:Uncharacterized protein n=1 Tax=Saccharibacter floricola DSM 15669 TaxID=1123227 RepID=A0ABQ0P048_9PROT|nr:hypothetical protein [Saccharibacter floricola]GBQ07532.1 hypothetical protein AA15669_1423 [Saccharibacter floricola DSM 15669]
MRVWTRIKQPDGSRRWQAVDGDEANIAWLQNALLLQLGEAPFSTDWGIPVSQTLVTRIWPDYYLNLTQERFRETFPMLQITRQQNDSNPNPSYVIRALLNDGTVYSNAKNAFNQEHSQTGPWSS